MSPLFQPPLDVDVVVVDAVEVVDVELDVVDAELEAIGSAGKAGPPLLDELPDVEELDVEPVETKPLEVDPVETKPLDVDPVDTNPPGTGSAIQGPCGRSVVTMHRRPS